MLSLNSEFLLRIVLNQNMGLIHCLKDTHAKKKKKMKKVKILKMGFLKSCQKLNFQYFYFIPVPTIATGLQIKIPFNYSISDEQNLRNHEKSWIIIFIHVSVFRTVQSLFNCIFSFENILNDCGGDSKIWKKRNPRGWKLQVSRIYVYSKKLIRETS